MKLNTPTVVDYGLGNLYSIERAIRYIGSNTVIADHPESIVKAGCLILPGVGAFGEGMKNIERKGLKEPILSFVASGRPFLGICLGMQLLMDISEELGLHQGLGLIKGDVVRFLNLKYKIPHVGWNNLRRVDSGMGWNNTILDGIDNKDSVYFVHSYIAVPDDKRHSLAVTTYGGYSFCSVVNKGNIYGCQFHPEKSGVVGLKILRNFLTLN